MDGDHACWSRLDPNIAAECLDVPAEKGKALSPANLRRFRRVLRDFRPDALLTSNFGTIEWALANQLGGHVRHIHMEDGFGPDEAAGRQLPRRVWLRRVALRRAEVVVPSRGLERIAKSEWRLPAKRVHLIPNGINTARFASTRARIAGPLRIGFVGALRPEKNVARLLRAFALLPPEPAAKLLIAGDGPERPALHALAGELGLGPRVRFLGALPDPEHVLADLDLFALSSDTEQMPLSLLEAMAAGLPAVVTDVGDIAHMLAEPNRRFVVARDERALTGAMATLLHDPAARHAIGAANQAKVRAEYDEARMAERYAALIDARPGADLTPGAAALPRG